MLKNKSIKKTLVISIIILCLFTSITVINTIGKVTNKANNNKRSYITSPMMGENILFPLTINVSTNDIHHVDFKFRTPGNEKFKSKTVYEKTDNVFSYTIEQGNFISGLIEIKTEGWYKTGSNSYGSDRACRDYAIVGFGDWIAEISAWSLSNSPAHSGCYRLELPHTFKFAGSQDYMPMDLEIKKASNEWEMVEDIDSVDDEFIFNDFIVNSHDLGLRIKGYPNGRGNDPVVSDEKTIFVNNPPFKPQIGGTQTGEVSEEYGFTFYVHDPNVFTNGIYEGQKDRIELKIDWGDGTIEDWFEITSAEELTVYHSYDYAERYSIKATARDQFYAESELAEYRIKITNEKAKLEDFPAFKTILVKLLDGILDLENLFERLSFLK